MARVMWMQDQVRCLIDIYREEPCLYAVKHPNYHNKNLRNVALSRMASVVGQVRANVTAKECQAKIHTLRSQFNIENSKRRSSLNKSGNGAADVYVPSLWYFNMLSFLDEHFVPRTSKSSCIGTATEEDYTDSQMTQSSTIHVNSKGFDDSGVLRVYSEDDVEFDESQSMDSSDIQSPESSLQDFECFSPPVSTPLRQLATCGKINISSRPQSAPPQSSSSSSVLPPARRSNKQKRNEDTEFVGAIQAIAETLKERPPAPQPPAVTQLMHA